MDVLLGSGMQEQLILNHTQTKQAGNIFPTEAAEAGHTGEIRRRWNAQARLPVNMGTSAHSEWHLQALLNGSEGMAGIWERLRTKAS